MMNLTFNCKLAIRNLSNINVYAKSEFSAKAANNSFKEHQLAAGLHTTKIRVISLIEQINISLHLPASCPLFPLTYVGEMLHFRPNYFIFLSM
jgi:hypothetical protein